MAAIALFIVLALLIIEHKKRKEQKVRAATSSIDLQKTSMTSELNDIDSMEGRDFEYWCADLLKYDGFYKIQVTPESGDQGVDIIAWKNNLKYAIQCKRYSKKLGNTPIQEVHTGCAIYGCNRAAVMTNQYFTPGAISAAKAVGVLL